MRIGLNSVFVQDQERALEFYTQKLGFEIRHDVPAGEYRYITVGEPDGAGTAELLLEPNVHPAARTYQDALFADGIPATSFFVDDLEAEVARLRARGVVFKGEIVDYGTALLAIFDDTCGNFIQLTQITLKTDQ